MQEVIDFYGEDKPKTLCVCLPLPGLSDENILPTFSAMNSSKFIVKKFKENHNRVCSLNSTVPNWELVDFEVYKQQDSFYEAIIVAYYKPITAAIEAEVYQKLMLV